MKAKPPPTSITWHDLVINCDKDLGRCLDHLEARPGIDRSKLACYGISSGAVCGRVFMAVDVGPGQHCSLSDGSLTNHIRTG